MAIVEKLFKLTAISQQNGEGGISTGATPLPWGPLGPTFSGASTNAAGTTLTRVGAFGTYPSWISGDNAQIVSGSSGTSLGLKTVSSKLSADAILLSASIGASKNNISGYLIRNSLAGGLLNFPTSLPASNSPTALTYDAWASFRPQDNVGADSSKMLRFATALAQSDDQTLSDYLATIPASSVIAQFGFMLGDINQDGTGVPYTVRVQPRNAGGALASVIADSTTWIDGGVATSGDYYQYMQPELFSFTLTKSEASDSLAFNMTIQQTAGDSFEACSLLGVSEPVLLIRYDDGTGGSGGGPRGRDRGRGRSSLSACN